MFPQLFDDDLAYLCSSQLHCISYSTYSTIIATQVHSLITLLKTKVPLQVPLTCYYGNNIMIIEESCSKSSGKEGSCNNYDVIVGKSPEKVFKKLPTKQFRIGS